MNMISWTVIKYVFFGLVSKVAQFIFDILFGPRSKDISTNGCLCYDICKDWKQSDFQSGETALFLLKYTGIKDITWLERDDVSLYAVEGDYFVFVRTRRDIDIYDAEKYPFLYIIKHDSAEEVIKVRLDVVYDYLRGTGRWGRDGANIAYLHNIGRCGSTLVTTMVNKTKQCHVLSEPVALLKLLQRLRQRNLDITRDNLQIREILKATFLLLTPDPDKLYFIKIHSMVTNLIPAIHAALPGVREMFMYRALKPTATSFIRAFAHKIPLSHLETAFLSLFGKQAYDLWKKHGGKTMQEFLVFIVCFKVNLFRTESADRSDMNAYRYEDLIKHKEMFCSAFFKDVGIDVSFVDIGLTALERDSQQNSSLSKDKVAGNKQETVSIEALEFAKRVCGDLGVVLEGEDYQFVNVDHTVTFQEVLSG